MEFENLKATELRLGLPGTEDEQPRVQKRRLELSETDSSESDQPMAKAQVVGWPPVRNYRRNSFQMRNSEGEVNGMFVKVRMDGAAYMRKLDLKNYKGYEELRGALESMFKDVSLEHTVAYEDKDGDWMLAGDVPWCMFVSSCKRLRIMKGSEARGLNSNR